MAPTAPSLIREATPADVPCLVPLFVGYLDFYGRTHDDGSVARYLRERVARRESVVLLAERDGDAVGFAQCYPTWSSLDLAPIRVLEDLFVAERVRRTGLGRALVDAVVVAAREAGCARVVLETQHTNTTAQALYVAMGFRRDDEFATYALELGPPA